MCLSKLYFVNVAPWGMSLWGMWGVGVALQSVGYGCGSLVCSSVGCEVGCGSLGLDWGCGPLGCRQWIWLPGVGLGCIPEGCGLQVWLCVGVGCGCGSGV